MQMTREGGIHRGSSTLGVEGIATEGGCGSTMKAQSFK